MSYTKAIFKKGCRYRVTQSFKSGPASVFAVGEVLVFERDSYSSYDNCFVYVFQSEGSNDTKEWWLPEDQPAEVWQDYFTRL